MAQSAHTPGPWEVDSSGHYINYTNPLVGKSAILMHEPFVDAFKKEKAANMALIAAAPDLLAALQEVAEGAGRYSKDPLTHAENCIEDMKAIARSAIAKATNNELSK